MALLEHRIIDLGLARLQALWSPSNQLHLQLKQTSLENVDQASLERATALYAGQSALTAKEFADLSWLPHFARSGRQLLLCHALQLLTGWNLQNFGKRGLAEESEIVLRLARSAGAFAAKLQPHTLLPITQALQHRIDALLTIRCQNPTNQLTKALTLLEASRVLENATNVNKEAGRILDQALPKLIAIDGGPTQHTLSDFESWIAFLLNSQDLIIQPESRHALDRARPFLSMFADYDQHYCFDRSRLVPVVIAATPYLQLAPTSGAARLAAGKTIAVALPQHLKTASTFYVSHRGDPLLQAGHFLHDQNEDNRQNFMATSETELGHMLQQTAACSERIVFISQDGNDIRIEDNVAADSLTRWMHLYLNPNAKISTARNGTTAMIAIDGRNLWQLTLRGAKISKTNAAGYLLIETTTQQSRINWALKRLVKPTKQVQSTKTPELPFALEFESTSH